MELAVSNPVVELAQDLVEGGVLFATQGGPLVAKFQQGDPDSRVLLLVGDNASGKSFMVRVLASCLNDDGVEPLQVSMKYRTMAGMHRCFMFGRGDEADSTGSVSLEAIRGAFRTAEKRDTPSWVMLDEPDTGLADGFCSAMGAYLAQFGNRLPLNRCEGLVVVTHSRKLVSSLAFALQEKPHVLCFSNYSDPDILQAWLEDDRDRSVEELLALSDNSMALFRKIQKLITKAK